MIMGYDDKLEAFLASKPAIKIKMNCLQIDCMPLVKSLMLYFAVFIFCHDKVKFPYRFINTLAQDVNITLGTEKFVKSYGVSAYRRVERGR